MIPFIFDNPAVLRMGWALLHFLWQGTVIALALKGALMLLGQRSSSRLRYALALACLFLMAALPVFLLCKPQRSNSNIPAAYETVQFETASFTGSTATAIPIDRKPDFRPDVSQRVAPLIPWIAAGWFLGMALRLLKTIGGVLQVRSLQQKAAGRCEIKTTASFHRLAARAGVADFPILESDLVSSPTVAGWFRPVILLPKGVLEKLDRPMLDALVAHEFAHIRRHDSVMNLLQTVVEDMLFFHPAMWWVTRSVRAEREACCDDDAVAICGDTLVYVRALSQAEQFRSSIPVIALSSSPLLQRIRRLTEMKISKMNYLTAFCITLFAVSFVIATAAGSALLATIPPQSSESGASASTSGGGQDLDQARSEARGGGANSRDKEVRYSLLCGIVIGTKDKATGKPVFFPPREKDGKPGQGMCVLLDVSSPKPSRVSGEIQASKLIHKVDPIYPEVAIKAHVGIRVLLNINMNEEGLVTGAEVKKSQTVPPDRDSNGDWVGGVQAGVVRGINSAAINAVKQWKYSPTLLNGKAIPVTTTTSITFAFKKDGSPEILIFP
ncbi:MAG TPA: M56 family metallopeptidase [Acidobacteriota bacterium]|nr:M56 family metallopeptidase [Acidobacteriota bacterium]